MRSVVIHSLSDALAAVRSHRDKDTPLRLLSPPYGASSLGAAVFLSILRQADQDAPGTISEAVLDCGDLPGLALDALSQGARALSLDLPHDRLISLSQIAAAHDARIYRRDSAGLHAIFPTTSPSA